MSIAAPPPSAPFAGRRPASPVVGFTGQRQVGDPAMVAGAIGAALDRLCKLTAYRWVALSSVAEGSDQLFAREALARGLSWRVILPLAPVSLARDFVPAGWREVETLLERAEQVAVSGAGGSAGKAGAAGNTGESGETLDTRQQAYLDCGRETVNGANLVIAVWDGQAARGKGGTAEVVAYARAIGRPLLIIDAITGEHRAENWSGFPVPELAGFGESY